MERFSGWEYLLIDVANHWGLDKMPFDKRIAWATGSLEELENLAEARGHWKEKPMYIKACMAIRRAQRGEPIGHLVGFDAVCSGMQIMSALTGCREGARATGLVDPDRRADAYTDCTNIMSQLLGRDVLGDRSKVKTAVMTSLYGSKKEPIKQFGEDEDELNAFYQAMMLMCPGPVQLLDALLNSWNSYEKSHAWQLPDGFDARIKVMVPKEERIEVEELNRSSFTYMFFENQGTEADVKNAANVVHSIDAYVLRSLVRRCSYNADMMRMASDLLLAEMLQRSTDNKQPNGTLSKKAAYYLDLYNRSGMADIVAIGDLTSSDIAALPSPYLKALMAIIDTMLDHPPFDVLTVHDDFKCHPNHMNQLRTHYRNILAELCDSQCLDFILSQLYHQPVTWTKADPQLSQIIRQSNYALC